MTREEVDDMIRTLAVCLDACLDHLDRLAAQERRAQAGKVIRQVTHQRRAETAREAVHAAGRYLRMQELGR